jgi:hypothetical protein
LQRHLRALGYLQSGIDGIFGQGTEQAVKALQYDLIANDGTSTSRDGTAPVGMMDYNRGRVSVVTGRVDQPMVACIADILDDSGFPRLPSTDTPAQDNRRIASEIAAMSSEDVPIPFLMAMMKQESNLHHFHEPGSGDDDTYITVGLDTNDEAHPERITSRGYGVGQYTLSPHEVTDFMLDGRKNVQKAIAELQDKFKHFVNGATPDTRADDRLTEFGNGPLRLCKYSRDDPRFLQDCRQCAIDAGTVVIQKGVTPLFRGSVQTYEATQYYPRASYADVPNREKIGCDWPYAARRYNGSGINSYHYQVRILKNLLG